MEFSNSIPIPTPYLGDYVLKLSTANVLLKIGELCYPTPYDMKVFKIQNNEYFLGAIYKLTFDKFLLVDNCMIEMRLTIHYLPI